MSLTGRPSRPPLALTSSPQIFIATSDILPLGASGPVSAMPNPILIGSPEGACAQAQPRESTANAAPIMEATELRDLRGIGMVSSTSDVIASAGSSVSPHLVGELHDHRKFRPLLALGEDVAFLGGRKAALRRKAELLHWCKSGCFIDAAPDIVLLLQRSALGGDEAEHDDLVSFRQETQRLESAGALGVVFEEIAVVVDLSQQRLRHRLIAALGNPGRAEIAATDVGGDGHIGRLALERGIDHAGVDRLQLVDIRNALARLAQLVLRAEIGPHGVVELKIAAAGIIECLHCLLVGRAEIAEEAVEIGIDALADAALGQTEMQHRGSGNGHLRQHAGVCLQELEMLQHGMVRESELADDPQALRLGLYAAELNALLGFVELDAVEQAEKIEMPPRAAELAVGGKLESGLLLPGDDLLDLAILDRLELGGGDCSLLAPGACFLEGSRTQEAADVISAERRFCSLHVVTPGRVAGPMAQC